MGKAGQWRRRFVAPCVTVLALATACRRAHEEPTSKQEPQPTLAAGFSTQQLLENIPRPRIEDSTIKRYVGRLNFVKELGPSDLRHVDLEQEKGQPTIKDALVWIQPERGSHRLTRVQVGEGRIIAQIWTDYPYPDLGLEPGWNWWWVGELRDTLVSVFVADRTGKRTRIPLKYVDHYQLGGNRWERWKQAIARLIPGTVRTWGTCGDACCQS